jgi:hypothetical protein
VLRRIGQFLIADLMHSPAQTYPSSRGIPRFGVAAVHAIVHPLAIKLLMVPEQIYRAMRLAVPSDRACR